MLSACEECLSVFPAEFPACPVCRQGTDWLCQTYDLDGPSPVTTTQPATTMAAK